MCIISQERQAHKLELNTLRVKFWRGLETGTQLGTNICLLFHFFVETLSNLAGKSAEINETIARHAGLDILVSLASDQQRAQPIVKRLAVEVLLLFFYSMLFVCLFGGERIQTLNRYSCALHISLMEKNVTIRLLQSY